MVLFTRDSKEKRKPFCKKNQLEAGFSFPIRDVPHCKPFCKKNQLEAVLQRIPCFGDQSKPFCKKNQLEAVPIISISCFFSRQTFLQKESA